MNKIFKKPRFILALVLVFIFAINTVAMAAAPAMGIYIGGEINKYYSLKDYIDNYDDILAEMGAVKLDEIAYVDADGMIATAKETVDSGSLTDAAREIKEGDLKSEYTDVNGNKIIIEVSEDLEVIEISAINETVTVGDEYFLPLTVLVTVEGEEEPVEMDVTWDNDVVTEEAGIFEFVGTLVLPEGYVNTDDVTVALTLTVEEAPVVEADLTAYEEALAAVEEADYTEASWAAYQEVVDANVVTVEDTQEDVDAATDAIVAAQDDLVTLEEAAAEELAAAVTAAEEAIADLPTVEEVTIEDAEAVADAKALVEAVKALDEEAVVEGEEVIADLEAKIEELEAEEAFAAVVAAAQEAVDELTLASATNVDSQEKVDTATALVQPAKDAIAAITDLDAEYDVTALNNAVATAEDNIAKAEAVLAAKGLVATAQETLLDEDYDAAQEAVDALPNSDAKTLENAKLIELEEEREAILAAVNNATNDLVLYEALNVKPFAEIVKADYITDYNGVLGTENEKDSITEVIDAIKEINENKAADAEQDLVDAANDAVDTLETFDFVTIPGEADESETKTQGNFEVLVTAANDAIAALPEGYKVNEEDELTLAETLQAEVDALVASNEEYVTKVLPVLDAEGAIAINNALKAADIVRIDNNLIDQYEFDEDKTVAELQFTVDLKNAQTYIGNGSSLTDQEDINKAQELVDFLPEDAEEITTKADLQDLIDNAQDALDDANAEAAALLAAEEAIEALTEEVEGETVLVEGVDQDVIDAAQTLLDAYEGEETTTALQDAIDAAQELYDTSVLEAAEEAIEALTEEVEGETVLVEGVDQDVIDAAQALLDAYEGEETTTALQDAIDAAQALLDVIVAEADAAEYKTTYADVLAISLEPEHEDQVVFEDLPAIEEALEAFGKLTEEAKGLLESEESKLEQLEASAKDRYRIDINSISGEGNMSEKLELLGNIFYGKLSEVQREEVAKLLIFDNGSKKADDKWTTNFTEFNEIEPALNTAIVRYKALLNTLNNAEGDARAEAVNTIAVAAGLDAYGEPVLTLMIDLIYSSMPEVGYQTVAEILAVIQ